MDKTLLCRCKDWDGYGFLNYWMKVLLEAEKCIFIIPFHAGKGMLEKWGERCLECDDSHCCMRAMN